MSHLAPMILAGLMLGGGGHADAASPGPMSHVLEHRHADDVLVRRVDQYVRPSLGDNAGAGAILAALIPIAAVGALAAGRPGSDERTPCEAALGRRAAFVVQRAR